MKKSCQMILCWTCQNYCPCIVEAKRTKERADEEDRRNKAQLVRDAELFEKSIENIIDLSLDDEVTTHSFPNDIDQRLKARFRELTAEEETSLQPLMAEAEALLQKHRWDYSDASNDPENRLIIQVGALFPIRLVHIYKLLHNGWLDDEIMNAFCCILLRDHALKVAKEYKGRTPRVELCSFFMTRLLNINRDMKTGKRVGEEVFTFSNVSRWTKKLDARQMRVFETNINIDNAHWIRGIADFEKKIVTVRDPYQSKRQKHGDAIMQWVKEEWKAKKMAGDPQWSSWKIIVEPKDHPKQSDCVSFFTIAAVFKTY